MACQAERSPWSVLKDASDKRMSEQFSNVTTVETAQWFCQDGLCPPFVGDNLVRIDSSHLTEATALAVVPLLDGALADDAAGRPTP